MNQVACLRAIVVLASASAYATDVSPKGGDEIIIADEVRTAFYEQAPRSMAAVMSKAVGSWCSTEDRHRVADSGRKELANDIRYLSRSYGTFVG
jgi:hypothetical protein